MTYSNALHALADPTRRLVFEAIAAKAASVGEIANGMPVSRPAVSQHIKVLSDAGLVTATKHGTRNIYTVRREGLAELRQYLDQLWGNVLGAFAEHIETRKDEND